MRSTTARWVTRHMQLNTVRFHCVTLRKPRVNAEIFQALPLLREYLQRLKLKNLCKDTVLYQVPLHQ
jgi:hypothetical protein